MINYTPYTHFLCEFCPRGDKPNDLYTHYMIYFYSDILFVINDKVREEVGEIWCEEKQGVKRREKRRDRQLDNITQDSDHTLSLRKWSYRRPYQ